MAFFQSINFLNNSISVISAQAFINQTHLTSLVLDENDITSYPNLDSCSHNMIYLQLSSNQLGDIPIGYFPDFPKLELLTLDGNGINKLTKDEMQGLYNLTKFSIAGNNIPSIACDTFADNSHLKILNLASNDLSTLPCIRSTPVTWSLEELNLAGNQITENHNASLAALFKNVIVLDLSDNDLKELHNFLTEMPKLKLLWLNGNTNLRMDPAYYENSDDLKWVKYESSDLPFPPLFGKVKVNLDYLDLAKNNIHCIDIDHISNMTNMTVLNFTENYLKLFPDIGCLTQSPDSTIQDIDFPKLKEIILTFNQISVFPLLPGMPSDSLIRLHHNELIEFPPERLALLTKVDFLEMQYNNATEFPDFSQVPSSMLTYLDLSHNSISSVPESHIAPLVSLKYLHLQYNFIKDLPDMSFAHKALTHLYIQCNLIHQLDPMILPSGQLWALTHLNVFRNFLTQVPDSLVNQLKSLEYLNISYNVLESMPCVSGVGPTLHALLLHHNNLTHIPGKCMERLSGLEILDLSYNLIAHFPFWVLYRGQLPSLKHANISNNLITQITTLNSPLIPESLQMNVTSNIFICTYEVCWLKNFSRFALHLEDKFCASPAKFVDVDFNNISEMDLGCYCE